MSLLEKVGVWVWKTSTEVMSPSRSCQTQRTSTVLVSVPDLAVGAAENDHRLVGGPKRGRREFQGLPDAADVAGVGTHAVVAAVGRLAAGELGGGQMGAQHDVGVAELEHRVEVACRRTRRTRGARWSTGSRSAVWRSGGAGATVAIGVAADNGCGRPKRYPCPRCTPSSRRRTSVASSSMPSAMVVWSNSRAMPMIPRTSRSSVSLLGEVANELDVDLQKLRGDLFEVAEAGKSGPEVVQRQPATERGDLFGEPAAGVELVHHRGLGHLDDQQRRVSAGFLDRGREFTHDGGVADRSAGEVELGRLAVRRRARRLGG